MQEHPPPSKKQIHVYSIKKATVQALKATSNQNYKNFIQAPFMSCLSGLPVTEICFVPFEYLVNEQR